MTRETDDDQRPDAPAFVLELYPSAEQQVIAGRFIAEAREKRRTGRAFSPKKIAGCWNP